MKIVVLDGFTLNPGDLSWSPVEALGNLTVHERTPANAVLARAAGAAALLTNKTVLSAEIIAALPDLRYIGVLATGYNVVDLAAARARGIIVTNIPSYGTYSVAQWAIALLLEMCCQVGRHATATRDGHWSRQPDFCCRETPLLELAGRTLGLIGVGAIGSRVAQIAATLGMTVIACDPSGRIPAGVKGVSLETLLAEADVVSLHCPLTPATRRLINREHLALMKPTAMLINTARGDLVDEPALADALNSGRLAGAALDVLSIEPPPADHPLIHARNAIVTPHVAWATSAARSRLLNTAADNLCHFLDGKPINVVS